MVRTPSDVCSKNAAELALSAMVNRPPPSTPRPGTDSLDKGRIQNASKDLVFSVMAVWIAFFCLESFGPLGILWSCARSSAAQGDCVVRVDKKPGCGMVGGAAWTKNWLTFDNGHSDTSCSRT